MTIVEPFGRPGRVLGEDRIVVRTVSLHRRTHPAIARITDVSDDDERVTAKPAHVTAGDVPVPVFVGDPLVVGVEQFEPFDVLD